MDATTSAILADQLRARGVTVAYRNNAVTVTNPLHPRVRDIVTMSGRSYLTDYGYEIGEQGDECATADRLVYLLGLPTVCIPSQTRARQTEDVR